MSTSTYTVGQRVIVRGVGHRTKAVAEGAVTKVGRKNVAVKIDGWSEFSFNMATGYEVNHRIGTPMRVFTPEGLVEDEQRTEAIEALRKHGIQFGYGGYEEKYTLADVKALLAIAEEVHAR